MENKEAKHYSTHNRFLIQETGSSSSACPLVVFVSPYHLIYPQELVKAFDRYYQWFTIRLFFFLILFP